MMIERLRAGWNRFTDPSASVTDAYIRRIAHGSMTASLIAFTVLLVLGCLGILYDIAAQKQIEETASHLIFLGSILPTFAIAYLWARYGKMVRVVFTLILLVTLAIHLSAIVGGNAEYSFYVSAVVIVLILFTLPPPLGNLLFVIYLIEIFLLSLITPGIAWLDLLWGGIAFNLVVGGIGLLIARQAQLHEQSQRQALQDSEARYRVLIDSLRDIVYVYTPEGSIVAVNPAFEDILGYPRSEGIGSLPTALIHPDDQARAAELLRTAARGDIPTPIEIRMRRHDGSYLWMDFRTMPMRDERGTVTAVTGVARDISIQKIAEAERLKRALEQERQAIIRQFVDAFAHYFRNALATISASVEVTRRILSPESYERVNERLERVVTSVQEMGRQLDSLNTVANLTLTPPVSLDVVDIVGNVIPALAVRAHEKGVRLFWMTQPVPPVRVHASALTESIRNLILNALHHTPPDGDVSVFIHSDKVRVYIVVRDSGSGIASDQVGKIFDPFYRIDSERGIDSGGIGLGLTIVRMLAETSGGEIRVESSPGAGSTFTLVLPVPNEAI